MKVAHVAQSDACAWNHSEWSGSESAVETRCRVQVAPLFVERANVSPYRFRFGQSYVPSWKWTPTVPPRAATHGNHLSAGPDVTRTGWCQVWPSSVEYAMNTLVSVTGSELRFPQLPVRN